MSGDSPHTTPSRKSLRRKPPPAFPQPNGPENAEFAPSASPSILHISTPAIGISEAYDNHVFQPVGLEGGSYRPMGPKELPEYDPNVTNYDPMGYETFERSPPYPVQDPAFIESPLYGRSPSLIYDRFQRDTADELVFDDSFVENDEELVEPEWEPIHDSDYESEPEESPTTGFFDYSILPDLPSAITKEESTDGSPTKRMTLNSAISFVKGNTYFDEEGLVRMGTRKKNEDLPPVPLDLPKLPFSSSSLVSRHFSECPNVWCLSDVFSWCLKLRMWIHDQLISKKEFKRALIKLLVYHKRDVPLDTIGPNVDQIVSSLVSAGAIAFDYGTLPNEDGEKALPNPVGIPDDGKPTKSNPGVILYEGVHVSGVLVDLTSCYCNSRDHKHENELKLGDVKLRCFSSQCYLNRVLDYEAKFRNTDINEIVLGEDWASHWKLTADDLKQYDKDVSKKQSLLFDLLRYEQTFIQRAKCFVEVVGPDFVKAVRTLIGSQQIVSMGKFDDDVINPGKELLQIHQKSLFEPLLKILISNGKFIKDIVDIGNIYYNWSQVVKPALLKYMSTVPMIEELLNTPVIKQWVDVNVRKMTRVKELKVNGPLLFMSTFNSRYQQLPLQLSDIVSQFDETDSDYAALMKAVNGIKRTAARVNEMKSHADNIHCLKRISQQLVWKSNVAKPNLNIGSENRRLIYRGDLTRKGDLRINSSLNQIILLDNYMLITDRIKNSKSPMAQYRVVENPIPVEFLLVEVREKESPTIELNSITKTLTSSPQQAYPRHELLVDQEDPSIYPFKVRHAGHGKNNSFVFSTKTERDRTIWVNHLMDARSNLCSRLNKVEPYNLKLISNTCFAYEESNRVTKLQSLSPNDPIEKMSTNSLSIMNSLGYTGDLYSFSNTSKHVVFSTVRSSASFAYNSTNFFFVGTSSGVYCSDMVHGWKRVVSISDTTKISVLPKINLVIMLSNNSLRYYPLDVLINYYYGRRDTVSSVALSSDAVSFFEVDKHREITMLFYAKKKGNSSGATNFKVCVPETDNDGIFSAFKVVKKFYVQAECFGISIFNSSFAVYTSKGIEILELDKLLPRSVPEIPNLDSSTKKIDVYSRRSLPTTPNAPEIDNIRRAIYGTSSKPMGMFKLNNNSEFLLVYNECAVFINKHGKLSRFSMLRFDYKARSIGFQDNHLFIVCEEAIEVWSISDFVKGTNRLIQVTVGKGIRMVNSQSLIFSMANPTVPGLQLVFQLSTKSH
ncbi:Rho guanine nucleotide exchange factor [Yamadazyma tenuis]|uniref:Rho guanine nucleotide exchange factor n=1 Tax=Candida tenuis TaxID=2315449 RepID=UPI00279F3EF9|nr:Rho guanine nucleotide exchange factor [Yamadazyma tenuis]